MGMWVRGTVNDTWELASSITCLLGGGGQSGEQVTTPGTLGITGMLGDMLGEGDFLLIVTPHRVLCSGDITGQTYHGDSFVSKGQHTSRALLKCQMQMHTHTHLYVTGCICDILICAYSASFCLLFKDFFIFIIGARVFCLHVGVYITWVPSA